MEDYYTKDGRLMKNVLTRTFQGYTYEIFVSYDSTYKVLHKGKNYDGCVYFKYNIKDDNDKVVHSRDSSDLNYMIANSKWIATTKFKRTNHNPFNRKYLKIPLRDDYDRVFYAVVDLCVAYIEHLVDVDNNVIISNNTTKGIPNSLI